MASTDSVKHAIYAKIEKLLDEDETNYPTADLERLTSSVLNLAEAAAWLSRTDQPHGGRVRGE